MIMRWRKEKCSHCSKGVWLYHIPQRYAQLLNEFNQAALNPYVNYHRPCLYPTIIIDNKKKKKKI